MSEYKKYIAPRLIRDDAQYQAVWKEITRRKNLDRAGWIVVVVLIILGIWLPQFSAQIWVSTIVIFIVTLIHASVTISARAALIDTLDDSDDPDD